MKWFHEKGSAVKAYNVPAIVPVLLQHITDDGTGRFDVRDGEEAVVVFVLGIYYHEHAVLCCGL